MRQFFNKHLVIVSWWCLPALSSTSTSAPSLSRDWSRTKSPLMAAMWSGVSPLLLRCNFFAAEPLTLGLEVREVRALLLCCGVVMPVAAEVDACAPSARLPPVDELESSECSAGLLSSGGSVCDWIAKVQEAASAVIIVMERKRQQLVVQRWRKAIGWR